MHLNCLQYAIPRANSSSHSNITCENKDSLFSHISFNRIAFSSIYDYARSFIQMLHSSRSCCVGGFDSSV